MTRTLEIAPDIESRLQVLAARRGASVETFAAQVLADTVRAMPDANGTTPESEPTPTQKRQAARRQLQVLAAGTRAGLALLSDEAISRESIYAGRGE